MPLAYVGGDNRAFDLLLSRNEVKLFSYIIVGAAGNEGSTALHVGKELEEGDTSLKTMIDRKSVV